MLNFLDEYAPIDAQSRSRHQKLFRSFNKCLSIQKQNGVLAQNLLFLNAGIYRTHIFQVAFHDFRTKFGFADSDYKGAGLIFNF